MFNTVYVYARLHIYTIKPYQHVIKKSNLVLNWRDLHMLLSRTIIN